MSQELSSPASSISQPSSSAPPTPGPRRPSDRDLEIYRRVKIWRHPQWEVAVDNKVTHSRVSQIVKKVDRWLAAGGEPNDPHIKEHVARQQLSTATHKMRLVRAIEWATNAMEREPAPLTTTKKRTIRGTEVWSEETTRDIPPVNLSAVRLLVRATEALHSLNTIEAKEPTPEPKTEQNLFPAVHGLLCRWRAQAAAAGRVPPVPDVSVLITTTLHTLLGTTPDSTVDASSIDDQTTAKETLELSADAPTSDSINLDPPTPCNNPSTSPAEKNPKC
jgi:hypothetical protein